MKDTTVKGAKAAGEKTKDVGAEVGDKAGDVKDTTVKGTKVAAVKTKAVARRRRIRARTSVRRPRKARRVRATGSPGRSKKSSEGLTKFDGEALTQYAAAVISLG